MTGIILAGGKNKRIGKDKSFIKIGGITIIDRAFSTLSRIFKDIIIITDTPDLYSYLGCKIYSDIIPGKDSLGGIYTGLKVSSSKHNFIFACDMPFLNESLIKYMIGITKDSDIVIPRSKKGFEPLHAIYSKVCIPYIEKLIEGNNLRILDFFTHVKVKEIGISEIATYDPKEIAFLNLNTEEDILRAEAVEKSLYEEHEA